MDKQQIKRLKSETVYLWDMIDEVLIKSLPEGGYQAKIPPDGAEFDIQPNADPVVRALDSWNEVSKADYDKGKFPLVENFYIPNPAEKKKIDKIATKTS